MSIRLFSHAAGLALGACAAAFALLEAKASKGESPANPDFLLILGCRVRADEAEATLKTRIEAAAKYLKENPNTAAVCCGGIVHPDQTKSEAAVIRDGLLSAGIDDARIILEDKSKTTRENFINAKKIIDGFSLSKEPKIAFLSSEFHLLRSGVIAKRAGVSALSVAAPSPKAELIKNYIREFAVFPAVFFDKKGE